MRLRKAHICGIWALGALAMIGNDARAQDATPTSATPVAATSSSREESSRNEDASSGPHSKASSADRSGSTVCFHFTLHCFSGHAAAATATSAHSAKVSAAAAATGATANGTPPADVSAPTSLNLAAPDIRTVVTPEELKAPLPSEDQQAQQADAETVEVRTDPNTPNIPGGFGALWWAMLHPTQVWRIFTPVE